MARTHTAYQRQAEQALYRSLSSPSSKCLETLSTNSEKAGFVRSLVMEYFKFLYKNDYQQATSYLLNALVNMHSLSDLRLRMFRSEDQIWIESLNKILWSVYEPGSFDIPETNCRLHSNVHFRLRTLYCDKSLDLFGIIRSQTELQILGIYEYHYDDEVRFLETLKQLQNAQLHLPVVVSLDSDSGYANFGRIGIYPAFNSIDRHPTIHQVLAESFDKGQTSYTLPVADAGDISELSIYLVDSDSCNISSVHVLIKNMAMTFPKITSLTFCFENPCEIVSFLLTVIILELKSRCVISAITGDEENCLFTPRPG